MEVQGYNPVLLHKDNLLGALDTLLRAIQAPTEVLCKIDHPYIDCINFDYDVSTFTRADKVHLARTALQIQFVIESLQHILEFIDFKGY